MPQRIIIMYSCSLCRQESDHPDKVRPYRFVTPDATYALDVCNSCEATNDAVRTLLDVGIRERGGSKATTATSAGTPADAQCEYCGDWFKPAGMGLHKSKSHNVKSKTATKVEVLGTGSHTCPECGFGAGSPQGLAAHRKSAHGVGRSTPPRRKAGKP